MTLEVLHDAKDGVGYVGALRRKGNVVWAVGGSWGAPIVMTSEGGVVFRERRPAPANGLRDVLPVGEKHALVVGESGALYETRDVETWREIETGTKGCLFALERAHGSMWLSGDDAFVMASADGTTWRKPKLGKHIAKLGRIQRLRYAVGALWFLGYEGRLGVLRKDEVELAPLESRKPITAMAFSPRNVGVVVGDGGTVFRSTNKGRTWERVEIDVDDDIEDVVWQGGRFIAVGAEGTLLVSEDGASFSIIPTDRDEHLWSVLPGASDGVIIGGDDGLVLYASKQTLDTSLPKPAVTQAEGPRRASTKPIAQDHEAISKRWREDGAAYYAALNAYVAQFYDASLPKVAEEPQETRKDMAKLVQSIAVQLNEEKRTDELRRMFPPSFEAFDYDDIGQSIQPALYADDGSVLARVSGTAWRMSGDRIEPLAGVTAFGRSHDRKHFAVAFDGRIEVRPGIDRAAATVVEIPKTLGDIKTIDVLPGGERLLVASESGVWLLSARGIEAVHGGDKKLSYVHAALSPDGRFIACGDQDSPHRIFVVGDARFELAAEIVPLTSYPHHAVFHDKKAHVCLSACHFARSSSLGLDLGLLDTRPAPKRRKVLHASGFDGDERLTVINGQHWIYSGIPREQGYLLGDRNGYVWFLAFDGQLLAYLHIGASMEAMDVSADNTRFLFGTCAGLLVEYDRTSDEPDRFKVQSAAKGREVRRWVFWRGFPPLVW